MLAAIGTYCNLFAVLSCAQVLVLYNTGRGSDSSAAYLGRAPAALAAEAGAVPYTPSRGTAIYACKHAHTRYNRVCVHRCSQHSTTSHVDFVPQAVYHTLSPAVRMRRSPTTTSVLKMVTSCPPRTTSTYTVGKCTAVGKASHNSQHILYTHTAVR